MAARPKSEKPLSEHVSLRVDGELAADMEALRQRDGMPYAEQIRRALRMFLEAKGIRKKTKRSA